jgi:hypothetical protein
MAQKNKNKETPNNLQIPKNYYKNPRNITEKQLVDLKKWLEELGDISGIVHDLNSNELIGGNQRSRVLMKEEYGTQITESYEIPTETGTVALGYILWKGERYNYRQVRWTPQQCEKANIIANKAGGTWDTDMLANTFELADLSAWGFADWELHNANKDVNLNGKEDPEDTEKSAQKTENSYVVRTDIIFDNEQQKDTWYAYQKWLKKHYQDGETLAERLHLHLSELLLKEKAK